MIKTKQIDQKTTGIITSISAILPFTELEINNISISLSGTPQIISINSLILILIFLQQKEKKLHTIFLIFTSIYAATCLATSALSNEVLLSASRTIVTFSTPFLISILISRTTDINQFSKGFMLGISAICTISIIYSICGAIRQGSLATTEPKYTLIINILGQELTQKISHRSFHYDGQKYFILRYSGIIPNANGLGLLCSISFFSSYFYTKNLKVRIIIQSIFTIGIMLSLSRMGILLFTIAYIYTKSPKPIIRQAFVILSLLSTSLFTTLTSSRSTIIEKTSSLFGDFSHHEIFRLGERGDLMATAWNGFLDNWLLGVGFGLGSEYLFPANPDTQAVHSVVLNSLVETGIIGTLPLLVLWLYPILASTRKTSENEHYPTQSHLISGILLGLFVAEAFDLSITRFHYIHLIFFTLLGIWFSLQQKSEQTVEQDAQSSRPPKMP